MVDMGDGDENFNTAVEGEEYADGNIRDWAMEAKTTDDSYLFHLVEPGRPGQCFFYTRKTDRKRRKFGLTTASTESY